MVEQSRLDKDAVVATVKVALVHAHALTITEVNVLIGVINDKLLGRVNSARGYNGFDVRTIKIGRMHRAVMC